MRYSNAMTRLPSQTSAFRWTPVQRTAVTAKIMLTVSFVFGLEALWRGSATRTVVAGLILALGGGLLVAAKHADTP